MSQLGSVVDVDEAPRVFAVIYEDQDRIVSVMWSRPSLFTISRRWQPLAAVGQGMRRDFSSIGRERISASGGADGRGLVR